MSNCTATCVSYSSPAHGGWGLVRVGMLIPQSYQLFVCPFACGRHGAIGASIHGNKDRLAYLYLEETDLISGSYEDLMVQNVETLLTRLNPQPRALLIMVSCIDDLLATDHQAFLEILREKHPHIRFDVGHMNPIATDGKLPPHLNIQRLLYSFLEPAVQATVQATVQPAVQAAVQPASDTATAAAIQAAEQDLANATNTAGLSNKTVNIIGCNMAPAQGGELYTVLRALGFEALHIGQFETFDEFQSMSQSQLNLLTTSNGQLAATQMQANLGIPFLYLPVNWDPETIDNDYQRLAAVLTKTKLPPTTTALLNTMKSQARDSLTATRLLLDNRPIAIDDTATSRPYSLAAMLCKHGFNVTAIATDGCPEIEKSSRDWLLQNAKLQELDYNGHNAPRGRSNQPDTLAIGMECAYLLQTSLIVDMTSDDQHYGYHGLLWLLEQMRTAATATLNLEESLMTHGLVI